MTDTILTSLGEVPSPFSFEVGRDTEVVFGVKKWDPATEDWLEFDISSARWEVYLRGYAARGDAAVLFNQKLDKSAAKSSWVEHPFYPGNTPRDALYWEAVLVDLDNAQAGTLSTKRERVLFRFRKAIQDAPQAPPAP